MPPAFAGSLVWIGIITHSSRCGLLVWRRLRRLTPFLTVGLLPRLLFLDLLQNPIGVIAGDEGDVFVDLQLVQ
jgi:hypothetical protein